MLFHHKAALPIAALALLPALSAHAQQNITIGTASTGGNVFPFGVVRPGDLTDFAAGGEYQEIYSSKDFNSAVPLTISAISFASASGNQGVPITATYNVTIGLSNTSATVGFPSNASTNFAANRGANFTTVFSGSLTAILKNNNTFDLVFPTAPFSFDPSQGNLLFDVVVNKTTQGTGSAGFLQTQGFDTQRVYQPFGTGQAQTDREGLFTQFTVTPAPVPETSTAAGLGLLLALGAGAAAFKRKRRA